MLLMVIDGEKQLWDESGEVLVFGVTLVIFDLSLNFLNGNNVVQIQSLKLK